MKQKKTTKMIYRMKYLCKKAAKDSNNQRMYNECNLRASNRKHYYIWEFQLLANGVRCSRWEHSYHRKRPLFVSLAIWLHSTQKCISLLSLKTAMKKNVYVTEKHVYVTEKHVQ